MSEDQKDLDLDEAQKLLTSTIRILCDYPDEVKTTFKLYRANQFVVVEVAEEDVGRVLGKRGHTIRAIEKLFQIIYSTLGYRVFIDVGGESRKRPKEHSE